MLIHNTDNFSCDVCSTTFSRLDTLNRHKMEVCNGEIAEFKFFLEKGCVKRENLNIITCEICTKVCGSYFQYMKHKKVIIMNYCIHVVNVVSSMGGRTL